VPYRMFRETLLDPNLEVNLLCLCRSCHSKKTPREVAILRGDVVAYCLSLIAIGFAELELNAALTYFGLRPLRQRGFAIVA
jgi:hypothetical protein